MRIVEGNPPNWEKINKTFDLKGRKVVFTYGDTLYNPHGGDIPPHLMVHEETHRIQQGAEVKEWWEQYLHDDVFRLGEELEAYQAQYRHLKKTVKDRNALARFLFVIAGDLSSPIYGSLITHREATKLITEEDSDGID